MRYYPNLKIIFHHKILLSKNHMQIILSMKKQSKINLRKMETHIVFNNLKINR